MSDEFENDPAELAADAEDWIEAFFLKLRAILQYSVGLLVEAGAFDNADEIIAAELGAATGCSTFDEAYEAFPYQALAVVAGDYMDRVDVPPFHRPLPAEIAAATALICTEEFVSTLEEVMDGVRDEENLSLDFNDICHLFWSAASIGSLGEVFRGRLGGFDKAYPLLDGQRKGARKGAAAMISRADRFRQPVVQLAIDLRTRFPNLGQREVARRICETLPDVLDQERVIRTIRQAERKGVIPRSTSYRVGSKP